MDHPGMDADSTLAALADIFAEVAKVPVAQLAPDKSMSADLGIDSLSMVEILTSVEERFHVTVPDDDVKKFGTVGELIDYVRAASRAG